MNGGQDQRVAEEAAEEERFNPRRTDSRNGDGDDDNDDVEEERATLGTTRRGALEEGGPRAADVPPAGTTGDYRLKRFEEVINADVVGLETLRQLSWNGIPEQYRAKTWSMLLGYLPLNASRREVALRRKRDEYKEFAESCTSLEASSRTEEECVTLRQIQADVPRTLPDLALFQSDRVQLCIERLLLAWASRHPATSYVQGMNDLVVPFFIVFLKGEYVELDESDKRGLGGEVSDEVLARVEADCYWCLTKLICTIQDHYTHDQPGIQRMVALLEDLLRHIDFDLWNHLQENGLRMEFFAFRWMNCLLVRELPLNTVIRLWDAFFSENHDGFESLHVYTCAALLTKLGEMLKTMGFDEMFQYLTQANIDLTQSEIETLLSQAYVWKTKFRNGKAHLNCISAEQRLRDSTKAIESKSEEDARLHASIMTCDFILE